MNSEFNPKTGNKYFSKLQKVNNHLQSFVRLQIKHKTSPILHSLLFEFDKLNAKLLSWQKVKIMMFNLNLIQRKHLLTKVYVFVGIGKTNEEI